MEQDYNSSCYPLGLQMSALLGCEDLSRGSTRMLSCAAQATLPRHVYQGSTGAGQSRQTSGLRKASSACPCQDKGAWDVANVEVVFAAQ